MRTRVRLLAACCPLAFLLVAAALADGQARDRTPEMTKARKDVQPFKYVEAKIPFYPAGAKWGTVTKDTMPMQQPLEPAESVKHFVHPADFELRLFASEPDIKRPICMAWDERGRLWVAETVDYPNERKRRGKGRDRIVVCEDTDNDGRADRFTVFADGLSIPTSMVFHEGGVIVQQAPDTLFLKDTDGDGKADERKVLFTGWSVSDTHAGPSNLHWGFDNWVYGILGYAGFEGEVGGEKHSFRTGFFRFRPDGSKLEFLRNTSNNSWGVGFSEEGVLFGSTANGNPSVYLPIPNRYYERVRGWSSRQLGTIAESDRFHPITDKVRQVDYHGKFTAGAGHALYTARTYPKLYWNRAAFVCEPTGHLVATFLIDKRGADYRSRYDWNLLASDDEWSSPIMAEVGPDGCVWVIDWYNYIVQHNPTPPGYKTGKGNAYETPLRDKTHGRVYRLVPKGMKEGPAFSLAGATPEKLVAALKSDNLFWRKHAQRLLVERGKLDVVPALLKLVADPGVDEIGLNVGAIHALWTLHGLGALDGGDPDVRAAAVAALKHKSAGVRRNAALVLPPDDAAAKGLLDSGVLNDPDGQARLAALLALADMPAEKLSPPVRNEAGAALAVLLARQDESPSRWLADALTAAAATHDAAFLTALVERPAARVLPPRSLEVVTTVAEHYARGGPVESAGGLLARLAAVGADTAEAIVTGVAKGWPRDRRVKLTAEEEKALEGVLGKLSAAGRGHLIRLAVGWCSGRFAAQAAELTRTQLARVADESLSDNTRIAAARQAVEFRPDDDKLVGELLAAVTPRTPPKVAAGILGALGESRSAAVGPAVVKRLPALTPQARVAALRVLLSRPESTRALLDAIDKGAVPLGELALDQKQALASHPDQALAARARKLLERGGGLPSADRQKVLEQLLPLAKRAGDAEAGKLVFRKHCATCHTHTGEGTKVGPDLTGMAVHPKEQLLTEILDPSRSVEGNYRVYTVTTNDGKVLNGLLASETKTSLELFDSEGKKHVLLREDVDELVASPKSLMPEGFEKQLTEKELGDVLAFLAHRGKYLPLPLERVANSISTRGMFISEDSTVERLVFPKWGAVAFEGVPFHLIDPQGDRVANVIMLYGPGGTFPPRMPKSVSLPCNAPAKAVHFLGGVSGWGHPGGKVGSLTMTVRLHYADGKTEDHPLRNGEHFADYNGRVNVPGSKLAFDLRGRQVRYLSVLPKRAEVIERIELVKGTDATAPVVVAVTVETRE